MPRGTVLSDKEIGQIEGLRFCNRGIREIARALGRSHHVIQNYLKNPAKYANRDQKGRKPKLSARDKRQIVKAASNSTSGSRKIRAELGLNVKSHVTVYNVIKKCPHLVREKMKCCPRLKPVHIEKRMEFARKYMRWTHEWNDVIFSDEKKFNLDGPDGLSYYWRDLRKEPRYFSKRNFGGGSVMVWLSFSAYGLTTVAFVPPRTDSIGYQKILQEHLLPYMADHPGVNFKFQQDNAGIHVSRTNRNGRKGTLDWLEEHNIDYINDLPACSCDWNPVENLWGILVRKIYADCRHYDSVDQLKKAIVDEVNKINFEILRNLVDTMYNRLFETVKKSGVYCDY